MGATARDQPALRDPLRSDRHLPANQTRPTLDYTFVGVAAGGDESDILVAWDPRRHLAGIPPLQAHRDAKKVGPNLLSTSRERALSTSREGTLRCCYVTGGGAKYVLTFLKAPSRDMAAFSLVKT